MTQSLNVCRLGKEISDAIDSEYLQIKEFCLSSTNVQKGVIIISSGRDYFVMGKYENKEYEITPNEDFITALKTTWKLIEQEGRSDYLNHIVITRGKNLNNAIVYPNFRND